MAPIETSHPLLDPAIIERMTDAVYALDGDGRFTYLNAAAASRFARQAQDLIGCSLWETFPEACGTAFHQQCQLALREGAVIEHDGYFPALHAHLRQRIYPSDDGITVLVIDVGVGVAEARYHAIFANAGMAIAVADLKGCLIDTNAVFQQMLGYSADELLQKRFTDITHPGDMEGDLTCFHELLAGTRDSFCMEKRYLRKDGGMLWARLTVSAMRSDDGTPTVIIGVVEDISASKREAEQNQFTIDMLNLLNAQTDSQVLMREVCRKVQAWTGCSSIGVRLRDGDDFPYYATVGFSQEFVQAETRLCVPMPDEDCLRDACGNPVLECMCGNVLQGRVDPSLPFFTAHGSFWTNSTSRLLASTSEAERQARTRNRCNGEGFESVALIPLRSGGETLGLLQVNDRQTERFTPEGITFLEQVADTLAIAMAQRFAREKQVQSDIRYRQIVETAQEGIWLLDNDGCTRYVNPQMAEMLGYTVEEMQGRHLFDFMDAKGQAIARENLIRRQQGVAEQHDFRFLHRNGHPVWTWIATNPLQDELGQYAGTLGMITDITTRKAAVDALQHRERLQQQVTEMLPVGIWLIDEHGKINEGNPAGKQIWAGVRYVGLDEYGEYRAWRADTGEIVTAEQWAGARAFTSGEVTLNEELLIQCFDGSYKTILNSAVPLRDAQGTIIGAVVANMDITERKRAEASLRESEERYRLATSAVNGVVYDSDLGAGSMHVSEGTALLLGELPETNPIEHDWWVQRIQPDDAIQVTNDLQDVYARGGSYYDLEYRMRHADGRWIDVWDRGYILRDADGCATRIIGSAHDITPLKEVDHAKDEFLAILSHELQTPLTSMLGFTDLAMNHDTLDMYRRAMPIIQRNAKRQARLVNELLDMSKLLQHRPECCPVPVDLGHLAMTKMEQMLPIAEGAGLTLQMTPMREPLPVCVDPAKMLLCIEHLIGNGVKFTPAGGLVTVECRQQHHQAILSVTDTGRGIAKEDLPKLFLPFRQVNRDEAAGGLGVGLAVVRGYVEWHGGSVKAESPGAGQGSTFTIYLPLLHGDAAGKALSGSVRKGIC